MIEGRYPPIEALVPHRAPMLLLDGVVNHDGKTTTCGVTIHPDSTFVEEGAVPSFIALEYMAQSVAAHAGLRGARKGQAVRVGYLIGARDVEFLVDEFRVGERLTIVVSHIWGDDVMGQFAVRCESGGRAVAVAQLNVYQGSLEEGSS